MPDQNTEAQGAQLCNRCHTTWEVQGAHSVNEPCLLALLWVSMLSLVYLAKWKRQVRDVSVRGPGLA